MTVFHTSLRGLIIDRMQHFLLLCRDFSFEKALFGTFYKKIKPLTQSIWLFVHVCHQTKLAVTMKMSSEEKLDRVSPVITDHPPIIFTTLSEKK